jgi:alkane 1-monooxygenase
MMNTKNNYLLYFKEASSFFWAYLLPLSVLAGPIFGGVFWLSTFTLGFIIVPILDYLVGFENFTPEKEDDKSRISFKFFNFVVWLYVPVQLALIYGGVYYIVNTDLALWEKFMLAFNVSLSSGALGFTLGHELGHKANKFEAFLTHLLYQSMNLMHFKLEHNVGHHTNVATYNDPATSRLNESFYSFFPRTVFGSYMNSFDHEKKRLKSKSLTKRIFSNQMYMYMAIQLLTNLAVFLLTGIEGLGFFLFISFVTTAMLELINYVEHYGLLRHKTKTGRYEKVQPHHSWNTNHKISNIFLFRLQRHSDHHANPLRPYQILRHFDDVPQMPFGYPTMVLMALVPPLWKKTMNPKVYAVRKKFNLASDPA